MYFGGPSTVRTNRSRWYEAIVGMSVLDRTTQSKTSVMTARLALGAVAGPVLFTVAWLVLGAISHGYTVGGTWISPYSAITQPISGLGLGETGPYMNTVFIVSGLLLMAGVIGILRSLSAGRRRRTRRAGAVLLAGPPIGLVVIGLFDLNKPVMHLLGATLILVTPVFSFLLIGLYLRAVPGARRFGTALTWAGPLTLLLFLAYDASFDQATVAAGHGIAGLTQRILFVNIYAWIVALAVRAYRSAS